MKSYPSYKDSGIEWIGEIPSHWKKSKLNYYCDKITDGTHYSPPSQSKGLPYVSVKDVGENTIDTINCKKISLEDFERLESEGCRPNIGDILLTKDGTIGRAAIVYENSFVILSSLGLITPGKYLNKRFLRYFLISKINIDQMYSFIHGSALKRLTITLIKNLKMIIPPLSEQTAIADFLDQKIDEVDLAVEKGEERIRLLKEYRAAMIHEAVTRGVPADIAGIDQGIEMKESGIEYIGEIPEHWEVKKLKWLINIKSGNAISSKEINPNGLYPVYGGNGITGYSDSYKFNEEIIVVGRVGAYCGSVYLIEGESWVTDNALIITTDFSNQLLYYILSDMNLNRLASKSAQPLITGSLVKDQFIVYPPTLEEQRQIVEYIETETARLDAEIRTAEEEIRLLQEYREALISEAVTGKIDVRDYPLN